MAPRTRIELVSLTLTTWRITQLPHAGLILVSRRGIEPTLAREGIRVTAGREHQFHLYDSKGRLSTIEIQTATRPEGDQRKVSLPVGPSAPACRIGLAGLEPASTAFSAPGGNRTHVTSVKSRVDEEPLQFQPTIGPGQIFCSTIFLSRCTYAS